jgi:membrane-bound lytic murein transglycosylase D
MRSNLTLLTRHWIYTGALLLLGACAHQAPKAPEREPIVIAAAPTAPETTAPADAGLDKGTPSLAMPREWQHHNGEDYDDLFDRQRGQRYLYHVVTEVEARGMPLEFALLPVVESAYEPFAYSVSRAAGMWQFIPDTGRRFGLKQNWWYDGRRDVIESTRASLDYLQALHDQFDGDWLLAIAAYNVGENSVQRELNYNRAHGKPTDFWHLKLPAETRAYVPKLLAMKRLMAEPERYGLEFAVIPNEPYFAVIDTNSQIDLKIAAQLAGTAYDELVALNPGYNRWATDPEGPHRMLVPIDNADGFETALQTLLPDDRVRFAVHEVARRETLAMIAKQYGVSAAVITKINELKGGKVTAGESLKIPEISGELTDKVLLAASRVDRPQSDLGGRRLRQIVYRVRAGETLSSIARQHGIPVSTLARLNNLGTADSLVKGQRLVIKASARRYRDEGGEPGRRVLYTVRRGDTVYSISRQFQVTVPKLKSWNGLNQNHQIRAGQRLVMYVDSNGQQG